MNVLKADCASDVVVIGAGLIGLAIALELSDRGAQVTVIERGTSLEGASTAAAGMLAVEDPGNPAALRDLSRLSAERYPAFLARIEELSGISVPFQTDTTIQYMEDGSNLRMAEHSLDPRQLAEAVRGAVKAKAIRLIKHSQVAALLGDVHETEIELGDGRSVRAGAIVHAAGAWTAEVTEALGVDAIPIAPCKGQMLRVRLPFALREVHRNERIYVCPRTTGPQEGTALIGASVENAGFDTTVWADDLAALRALAAEIVPELGLEAKAPMVEAWAGLRPATPDKLPVVGRLSRAGHFIASGHYRNGILQAPGTAIILADLIQEKTPAIDISKLSAQRFETAE